MSGPLHIVLYSTSKRQDLIHLDRYLIHAWAVASKFNTGGSAVLGSPHIRVLNSDPNVLNLDVGGTTCWKGFSRAILLASFLAKKLCYAVMNSHNLLCLKYR